MARKHRRTKKNDLQFSSVAQSCPTLSTPWIAACHASLSITTPLVYSNLCPSSQWCHPAISSSVVPFSSWPQSLPASGSFPMSQLCIRWPKYWSFSFSISPSNEHPGLISFRMDWLISLQSKGLSSVFSNTTVQKHQFCKMVLITWKAIMEKQPT